MDNTFNLKYTLTSKLISVYVENIPLEDTVQFFFAQSMQIFVILILC